MTEENQSPVEGMAYEQALFELESIVNALETEELPLEQALKLFERGQALAHHCAALLDQAELRVQQIVGDQLENFKPQP